jgi:N-acetyl-anhydromuramyl-L-alanine amidase AmpD
VSFVWKADNRLKSPEQVAQELVGVARGRGMDDFAAVLAVMCVAQESDFWCPWNKADPSSEKYAHDSESDDGRSVAYFQQQNGRSGEVVTGSANWWGSMASRMDLKKSGNEFMARLDANYMDAVGDPALAGQLVQNVQRSAYPDAYAKHWGRAWQLVRGTSTEGAAVADDPNRPDFNEYEMWSPNSSDREGTVVDLFLLHTQEGDGNADSLAQWMPGHGVSYHYCVSQDYEDHGVTVVDVVDTDRAAWAVLSANNRSINLCFAGSRAAWTRDEWLKQSGAIDVAAYLAAADCKKYKIEPRVIKPPYNHDPPGVSDHRYVTQWLKDGNHTDVGLNFPWDVFEAAFIKYHTGVAPAEPAFVYPSTEKMVKQIWEQLFGPQAQGWESLFGKTGDGARGKYVVEAIADIYRDRR